MLFLCLTLLFLLTNVSTKINAKKDPGIDISQLLKKANDAFTLLESPLGQSLVLNHLYSRNISSICLEDFKAFGTGLINGQKWALDMFDAYGKMPSGILEGNLVWSGRYSKCRNVIQTGIYNNASIDKNTNPFHGQFCWINIEPKREMSSLIGLNFSHINVLLKNISYADVQVFLKIAVCVPDSCTSADLNNFLGGFNDIESIKNYINISGSCPSNPDIWKDTPAVIALLFCLLVITLLVISTTYDVYIHSLSSLSSSDAENPEKKAVTKFPSINRSNGYEIETEELEIEKLLPVVIEDIVDTKKTLGTCGQILLCFSLYSNGAQLFNCESQADSLKCLDGIRVLSMTWIIFVHIWFHNLMPGAADNSFVALDLMSYNFLNDLITVRGFIAVDTFFTLSGLLLTRSFLKRQEKVEGSYLWILKLYFLRYLRLTPVYAVVLIIFQSILFPYYSNSPLWPRRVNEHCYKYWWKHLLYINNIKPVFTGDCLGHTWYLASDMQLHVISPIILIFLHRFKFIAAVIAGCLVLSNWLITGFISTYYRFGLSFRETVFAGKVTQFNIMYEQSYDRIGPFVIGMACGYLLQKQENRGNTNKTVIAFGWVIAAGLSSSVVFGAFNTHPSQGVSSLYYALAHSTWSLALSWMIYACCNGFGGFVNRFLSLLVWKPLSRLTYSAYLIHMLIIHLYFLTGDETPHFTQLLPFSSLVPIAVYTYISSIFFYLAFEAPFMKLIKLILF